MPVQATPADEGVDVDEAEGFTALKLHHYVKPSLSVPAEWNKASRLSMFVCVCRMFESVYSGIGFHECQFCASG